MNQTNSEKRSLSFHCTLCSQVFQTAFCLINCGHTFCLKCFNEKIQVTQREGDLVVVKCTTCNMSTWCTENAETELREPVVESLVEILGRDKIPKNNKELCGSGPECGHEAEYWCPICDMTLCGVCFDQHFKTPFTKKHHNQVTKLDQKKKEGKSICSSCNASTNKFCENCQQILCAECFVHEHNGHRFSDIVAKAEEKKSEFGKFINEVKEHLDQTQKKSQGLKEQIGQLQLLLKEQIKRETLLKITYENLKLVQSDLNAEIIQLGTLNKLEKELRRKIFQQTMTQEAFLSRPLTPDEKEVEYIVDPEEEKRFIEACENGDQGQVIEFIRNKVNPNVKCEYGWTGLMWAARNGHREVVSLLISSKPDLNSQNQSGDTGLILACYYGHEEMSVELISSKACDVNLKDKNGSTALMYACQNGLKEVVSLLISSKPDLNWKNQSGYTGLMLACKNGQEELVSLLISSKADLNWKSQSGYTGLMLACLNGRKEICSLLLQNKANHKLKDNDGRDALYLAKNCTRGTKEDREEMIKLFAGLS